MAGCTAWEVEVRNAQSRAESVCGARFQQAEGSSGGRGPFVVRKHGAVLLSVMGCAKRHYQCCVNKEATGRSAHAYVVFHFYVKAGTSARGVGFNLV